MLLVDPVGRSGDHNMSLDLELLVEAALGARLLRLYCWDPPTLSIGRNQSMEQITDRSLPVVRRPTGGKAVWHEHEVTYAVAAPIATFGSLRSAYREIHTRIAAALRSLGADAALAGDRPAVRPSDRPTSCFASSVGGEILVHGRKLVGSAQVRRGAAFLQHGSILLAGTQPGGGAETTVAGALGRSVCFDELARAIVAAWSEPVIPSDRPTVRHCFSRPPVKC
jgi:lipoate-protein ligase A